MYFNLYFNLKSVKSLKLRSQPVGRLFCPYVFWRPRSQRVFFLNTCVGRAKSKEEELHIYSCARCEYVARTLRLGVSGCVYRTLRGWWVVRAHNVQSPCDCHVNVWRQYLQELLTYGVLTRWPVASAYKRVERESISTAVGCWSVCTPCVVSAKHVLARKGPSESCACG